MKLVMFLSALIFTSASLAETAFEQVGLNVVVSVDEKVVSQPYLLATVGDDFSISQVTSNPDGSISEAVKIEGQIFNCGDGTYTIHMNLKHSSLENGETHASLTLKKNETGLIAFMNQGTKVSFKLTITDPR